MRVIQWIISTSEHNKKFWINYFFVGRLHQVQILQTLSLTWFGEHIATWVEEQIFKEKYIQRDFEFTGKKVYVCKWQFPGVDILQSYVKMEMEYLN